MQQKLISGAMKKLVVAALALALSAPSAAVAAGKTVFQPLSPVPSAFLNTIYSTNGGHKHDGVDADGHAGKIDPSAEIDTTKPFNDMITKGPVYDVRAFGAKGNGSSDDTAAVQTAINSLPDGGVIFFPPGTYRLTNTITLKNGITLRGSGKNPTTGNPTRLSFSSLTGATPAITINTGYDITIENMYITGRSSGSGNEINILGSNARVNLNNLIINSKTTGSCVYIDYWLITSEFHNIATVGGAYGFTISAASTSVSLYSCYAQLATSAGYLVKGTYLSLYSCAADNCYNGYRIEGYSASQIGLYNCGAEYSTRSSVVVSGSVGGVTIVGFRSHDSNKSASSTYPSFLDIVGSDRITVIDSRDSIPNAATSFSIGSSSNNPGSRIVIINPMLDKPLDPTIEKRLRLDGGMFIGGKQHTYGTAAPASGSWNRGDMVYNTSPSPGGYAGWICTSSGSPGTWKGFGLISQ